MVEEQKEQSKWLFLFYHVVTNEILISLYHLVTRVDLTETTDVDKQESSFCAC